MDTLGAALAHIAKLQAGTRIAVVGSREFPNLALVSSFVRSLPASCILVSGGARGVDTTAEQTWRERGLSPIVLPFMGELGRAGGPARNSRHHPDSCVKKPQQPALMLS